MTYTLKASILAALAFATQQAALAQTTVFSDNFSTSTFNGASTPTSTSTSYDVDSSKTGAESITSGNFTFGLSAATTSGFLEAQALFTTSPVTLATPGDYIDLTYTFTDTANLLAGGTSSYLFTGLFGSGGNAPVAGTAGTQGNAVTLSTTSPPTPATLATANAALWQGYVSRIAGSGGNSEAYTRPQENGATVTDSANQDLIGNDFGSGAYDNPAGTQVGGTLASTAALTTGSQYTLDYRLTLTSAGVITISDNLYSGVGTGGTLDSSQSTATSSTLLTSSFDGLAIGIRNSGTSLQPTMDINQLTVISDIQAVPEPNTFALFGGGIASLLIAARRRQKTRG
jgi:hypothetical protein